MITSRRFQTILNGIVSSLSQFFPQLLLMRFLKRWRSACVVCWWSRQHSCLRVSWDSKCMQPWIRWQNYRQRLYPSSSETWTKKSWGRWKVCLASCLLCRASITRKVKPRKTDFWSGFSYACQKNQSSLNQLISYSTPQVTPYPWRQNNTPNSGVAASFNTRNGSTLSPRSLIQPV